MTAPDAVQKAPFDPHARFVARDGLAYKDFARFLCQEPDPEDQGNREINLHRLKGRSEAFCRFFRKGYDAYYPHAVATSIQPSEAHFKARVSANGFALQYESRAQPV